MSGFRLREHRALTTVWLIGSESTRTGSRLSTTVAIVWRSHERLATRDRCDKYGNQRKQSKEAIKGSNQRKTNKCKPAAETAPSGLETTTPNVGRSNNDEAPSVTVLRRSASGNQRQQKQLEIGRLTFVQSELASVSELLGASHSNANRLHKVDRIPTSDGTMQMDNR